MSFLFGYDMCKNLENSYAELVESTENIDLMQDAWS